MLRLVRFGAESPGQGSKDESPVGHDPLRDLAAKAATGERPGQRTLLFAVGPLLLRVIRGSLCQFHPEVEDVFKEACLSLLMALPRFRGECPTLYFASRIAVLTAMNARRRMGASKALDYDSGDPAPISAPASPADHVVQARQREALRNLMDQLPAARAEVLVLHVLLGYTVEETAAATGVPVNTVRSRLRRALNALRERLQADRQLSEVVRGDREA
jgi:RNA polymerase sigma-70 factor, ECF subfamily